MPGNGVAGGHSVAEHDVDQARRYAGPNCEFGKIERRKGCHLGWLEDNGIAGGKCRAEFPRCHVDREIPWGDGTDHSIGFRHDHAEIAIVGRHQLATFLVGEFGEEADLLGGDRDIARDQLTDWAGGGYGFQPGQRFRLLLDEVGPAMQEVQSLARAKAAPIAGFQRRFRGLDCLINDIGVGNRAAGIVFPVGWPLHRDHALGRDKPIADKMPHRQGQAVGLETQAHRYASGYVTTIPSFAQCLSMGSRHMAECGAA
ncbi:hypothetical protein D3C73_552470 [compost metagenome]